MTVGQMPASKSTSSVTAARASSLVAPLPGNRCVLLVEDDAGVRESLRRVLVGEGLQVLTAGSGEEAVEYLQHVRPAVVVTDLCMKLISGWDLVFHHHLHEAGLPFVVITAVPRRDAGGVDKIAEAFFQKPLNLEELLATVHRLIRAPGAAEFHHQPQMSP